MTSRDPSDEQIPLFVERQTYRRRRLMDAIRALPVLGLMLWWVPLLWLMPSEPVSASSALVYVFVVWIGLVLGAAGLIQGLHIADKRDGAGEGTQ